MERQNRSGEGRKTALSTEARLTLPSQVQHTKPVFLRIERRLIVLEGNGDGMRVIRRLKKKKKKKENKIERMRGEKRDKRRAGEGRKGRLESRDCQRRDRAKIERD